MTRAGVQLKHQGCGGGALLLPLGPHGCPSSVLLWLSAPSHHEGTRVLLFHPVP